MTGEVWLQPGQEVTQAKGLRASKGGVALVLGAGNQLPAVALDALHKLVVDGEVVLLKMNPVNDYLGPHIAAALAPLTFGGFLALAIGGADVGARLAADPRVDTVHLTGSASTYDALVWGPGASKTGAPKLAKRVTGELGCVTPIIITPGPWSQSDLDYVAAELVAGAAHNAGHNCLAAEIVLTDASWPLRPAFLDALRAALNATPRRVAYYPGSAAKAAAFRAGAGPPVEDLGAPLPGAGTLDPAAGVVLPWMLRAGLAPDEVGGAGGGGEAGDRAARQPTTLAPLTQARTDTENWCGALQEVALPGTGGGAEAFLKAATAYANQRVAGTLSCVLFAHPATPPTALEAAIAGLEYGCVCVNVSNVLGFSVPALTWGAHLPGGPPAAIGTGNVAAHNAYLLDGVQKSVLRAPWRVRPAHLWSPAHRNLEAACGAAVDFFAGPSVPGLLRVAAAALRG